MLQYINPTYINEELERDVERILENNYSVLFSETGGNVYNMNWVQARAIYNNHGAYRKVFDDMIDLLNQPPAYFEKMGRVSAYDGFHRQASLLYLHLTAQGSLQKLVNEMKKVLREVQKEEGKWNIVKYTYQKNYYG